MTNKLTGWAGNDATIKVESNAAAKDSLIGQASNSASTYGWTVTEISDATTLGLNGWVITTGSSYNVCVNAASAVNNVNGLGIGSSTERLDWKLKTVKRYKGTEAGLDLSTVVSADGTTKWLSKAVGATAADQIYVVGVKAKISGNEPTTSTTGVSSTIVVVPRHASSVKILKVAQEAGFMKHEICLRAKTGEACDVEVTATKTAAAIAGSNAKFFNQVWSLADVAKPVEYDSVSWDQTLTNVGDCNNALTYVNCKLYKNELGNEAAVQTRHVYITRSSNASGYEITYDEFNVASDDQTLNKAKTQTVGVANKMT